MSNLRDHRPNVTGNAHRDLLTSSLRAFDLLFAEWTEVRGIGHRGSIRGSHAQDPKWENELIHGSMGHHPASVLTEPCCYNQNCDFDCENNRRVLAKLKDIAKRYASVENPWQTDFEVRLSLLEIGRAHV